MTRVRKRIQKQPMFMLSVGAAGEPPVSWEAPAAEAGPLSAGACARHVLFVDDDPIRDQMPVAILASDGITEQVLDTGSSALTAVQSGGGPHVAVFDYRMPDLVGIDLATALKARNADLSVLPLAQHAGTGSATAAVRLVDTYLTKPIQSGDLLRSVRADLEDTHFRGANPALVDPLPDGARADPSRTVPSPVTAASPADFDESPSTGSWTAPRALLVEDIKVNQVVATAMLKRLGYQVDLADDGRGAIRAAQSAHYDVILMDCLMPVMDGYEATSIIRSLNGPARNTQIIAVTAAGDRERCLLAGMDDFVAKPIDRAALQYALSTEEHDWPMMTPLGSKEAALLEANLTPGEVVLGQVVGRFRQVVVATDQKAIVIKTGVLAAQALGGKATCFDYRKIGAVELRTGVVNGEIELINDASPSTQGNHNRDKLKVSESPHGVIFRKSDFDPFHKFASKVRENVASFYASTDVSIPDQIHQLAELHAVGVLTEKEFSTKKAELLKRM